MMLKITALVLSLLVVGASAQCNEDEHHPENGGYFFVGAAGVSSDVDLDSAHGQMLPNSTWAIGMYVALSYSVLVSVGCTSWNSIQRRN